MCDTPGFLNSVLVWENTNGFRVQLQIVPERLGEKIRVLKYDLDTGSEIVYIVILDRYTDLQVFIITDIIQAEKELHFYILFTIAYFSR